MVEYPFGPGGQISGRKAMVLAPIDEPPDVIGSPRDGENMKVVGVISARERIGAADSLGAGVTRTMQRAVSDGRLAADVLHDVDLAALGPPNRIDVVP